jgi:tRNA A-37 threonylcarbamoyl transferase component Bud32/WD40 repeat protein
MPISPGDKLGPYEILAPIGKGGMGEVWKAHDPRLNRDVAIKVSAAQFSERFEREAKAIAALNHPNICQIYDVGPDYLVMEYVEGTPLKGPLPLDQALKYAVQICDALDAANKKSITHRDLKPANILATKAGIKLLDFGLAKLGTSDIGQAAKTPDDATLTMALTGKNEIVGTLYYMSPEQLQAHANGQEIDARSDIFSFGLVLYEMLTGKRAFEGSSPASVIAAIMERPAPSIATIAPPALDRLLQRCLAKDPDDRWQSARDLKAELEWIAASSSEAITVPTAIARHRVLPWAVAGAFALAFTVAGVLLYNTTRPPPSRPLMRLNAEIAPDTPLARGDVGTGFGGNLLALSRDGARLALTLRGADGKVRLHTRLLNQSQVTPLAGTENAYAPFFSPEGDWIGFFADGKLKKIAVEGGAAVTLCDAPLGVGGSWGDDGNIIAALNITGVLSRVPSGGGMPVPVTKLNSGEVTHRWPQVLPRSQAVLFTSAALTSASGYDDANIDVISLKTGERKTIERGGFSARYLVDATGSNGTGHLIYLHQATLFAVPFDPGRLALTGAPASILEDVTSTLPGGGDFAFAQNGTFVYLSGKGSRAAWPISWVDSSGKTQPLHAPPGQYYTPRFSPDGKRLAFSMATGQDGDIWVKDLDRDTPSRLSFLPGVNRLPVWTPDGKNIVFQSTNPAAPGLYGVRSDGSGEAKRLTEGKPLENPSSFSPDGKRLAFNQAGNGGSQDIFTMPVEVDPGRSAFGVRLGKAELFLGTPFNEGSPAFSPDGRWLAYRSNESGTFEVYVRPFPGPGGRWQVSTGGGRLPLWSRDGLELLFETADQHVMAVSYTTKGDSFAAGKPRVFTETHLRRTGVLSDYDYDLAPDGKRLAAFLADDANSEKPLTHLTFLLNFFDELRRKVPTGK